MQITVDKIGRKSVKCSMTGPEKCDLLIKVTD
jgi:hypothetical protein